MGLLPERCSQIIMNSSAPFVNPKRYWSIAWKIQWFLLANLVNVRMWLNRNIHWGRSRIIFYPARIFGSRTWSGRNDETLVDILACYFHPGDYSLDCLYRTSGAPSAGHCNKLGWSPLPRYCHGIPNGPRVALLCPSGTGHATGPGMPWNHMGNRGRNHRVTGNGYHGNPGKIHGFKDTDCVPLGIGQMGIDVDGAISPIIN